MSLLSLARRLRAALEAEEHQTAADLADADPALAAVLDVFAEARIDSTAGTERTWQWPARYGALPADFDALVPARQWLAPATVPHEPVRTAIESPQPLGDDRAALLALAAGAGWPRTPLRPATAVCAGEDSWRRFVAVAAPEELAVAGAELQASAAAPSRPMRPAKR